MLRRISSSRTRHGSSLEGPLKLDEIKKAELGRKLHGEMFEKEG